MAHSMCLTVTGSKAELERIVHELQMQPVKWSRYHGESDRVEQTAFKRIVEAPGDVRCGPIYAWWYGKQVFVRFMVRDSWGTNGGTIAQRIATQYPKVRLDVSIHYGSSVPCDCELVFVGGRWTAHLTGRIDNQYLCIGNVSMSCGSASVLLGSGSYAEPCDVLAVPECAGKACGIWNVSADVFRQCFMAECESHIGERAILSPVEYSGSGEADEEEEPEEPW